jgi:hypothetical protein
MTETVPEVVKLSRRRNPATNIELPLAEIFAD